MRNLFRPENTESTPLSQKHKISESGADIGRQKERVSDKLAMEQGEMEAEKGRSEQVRLLSLLPTRERGRLTEAIERGSGETLSFLAQILACESAARNSRATILCLLASLILACLIFRVPILLDLPLWVTQFGGLALGPLLAALALTSSPGRRERAAFDYLLRIEDRRSTGLLLERLHIGSSSDRQRVGEVLEQRLPEFGSEDLQYLTSLQRQQLNGLLSASYPFDDLNLRLAAIGVVERLGGRDSLGTLYQIAAGEAALKGDQTVRAAAQKCLYALQARLDFGGPEKIPEYLLRIGTPPNSPSSPATVYADNLYALIAVLPQLTPDNYRSLLSRADRNALFALLSRASLGNYGYDHLKLYREVIGALARVGEIQSMNALRQVVVMEAPTDGAKQLRAAAKEALSVLRQQLEKEKVSKTLLRASSAPEARPEEMLRAAAPAESVTTPNELLRASVTSCESDVVHNGSSPGADADSVFQGKKEGLE